MFTWQDYRDGNCSPQQFHGQFVDETVLAIVETGIGRRNILASKHPQMHDISARDWDLIAPAVQRHVKAKIKELGGYISISLLVGISKQAAMRIKEKALWSAGAK